jgi:hypothetical protein
MWVLLTELKKAFEIKPEDEYRIRNLTTNKMFVKEDMTSKLRAIEGFEEGGMRLAIEIGRPTTMAEIGISVIVHKKDDDCKHFFLPSDVTVGEARATICKEFGEEYKEEGKFTLYRVDAFEEPTYALRRATVELKTCSVSTGDLLVLKSNQELLPEEKLKLSVHCTQSGLSEDSTFL